MNMRSVAKKTLIDTGLYRPIRRTYHRLFATKFGAEHRQQVAFYSQFLSAGDLCFDVGANIGAKAEVFLDLGCRVVSFEPEPNCRRELRARCGKSPRLTVVAAAVGKEVGEAVLFVSKQSPTSSMVPDWSSEVQSELRVPVVTLDSIIAERGLPKFCKIDVEGFELEVLRGLSQPIPMISLEYHLEDRDIKKTFACLDLLANMGYLSMNVSLGEEPRLAWPEWVSLEQFRQDFPAKAPRSETIGYGDVFIRIDAR